MTSTIYYHEGRIVRSGDLSSEQSVANERFARHVREVHGWGIVRGLGTSLNGANIDVSGGFAVDDYGHLLRFTGATVDAAPGDDGLVLCLRFHRRPLPGQSSRLVEEAHLVWASGFATVLGDTDFAAVRVIALASELPENSTFAEPEGPRPVPLWRKGKGAQPFREAGVVGERLVTPDGRALLQVGDDPEREFLRFRIAGRAEDGDGQNDSDRLTINRSRRVRLQGAVEVRDGHLWVQPGEGRDDPASPCAPGGGTEKRPFSGCLGFKPLPERPADEDPIARPWSIYAQRGEAETESGQTLRAEIPQPGEEDNPANYRAMISRDAEEPQLTIKADNTVVIGEEYQGNPVAFIVDGAIAEGPIRPIPEDPRYFPWLLNLATSGDMKIRYATDADRPTLVDDPSGQGKAIVFKLVLDNTGRLDITGVQIFVSVVRRQTWIDSDDVDEDNDIEESITGMRPDPRFQRQIDAGLSLPEGGAPLSLPRDSVSDEYAIRGLSGAEPNLEGWIIAVMAYGSGPVGNLIYTVTARRLKMQTNTGGSEI